MQGTDLLNIEDALYGIRDALIDIRDILRRRYEPEEPKEAGEDVNALNISIKTRNRLYSAGCFTVGDVVKRSPRDIRYISGVGITTYNEIKDALLERGWFPVGNGWKKRGVSE